MRARRHQNAAGVPAPPVNAGHVGAGCGLRLDTLQPSAPRLRPSGALGAFGPGIHHGEIRYADARLDEGPQSVCRDRCPELLEHALHKTKVQCADNILVALGHLAERALVQTEPVAAALGDGLGSETDLLQRRGQLLDGLVGVRALVRRRRLGQITAPLPPASAAASPGCGITPAIMLVSISASSR